MDNHKQSDDNTGKRKFFVAGMDLDEVKSTIRRDFKEVKEFFLEEERIRQLEQMGRVKRWFFSIFWLLKSLFSKLTAVRRLLLVISLVLIFINLSATVGNSNVRVDNHLKIVGGLILLFILMLELKDKLLARDELAAGRSVQLALMPETSPEIPGWDVWFYSRPANDVGGDLLDYIRLEGDRFGLALGDVAGKGLPAALFMAKLQATLRALATEFDSVAELGTKLNEIFHRDSIPKSFASLVYLELKPNSGNIHLLNAGHPPPLILTSGEIHSTGKGNLALGIRSRSRYEAKHVELQPGDFFIVYSDGVTEAQDENDEFFGNQRLDRLLSQLGDVSAREVGSRILSEVDRFVDEAPWHDDLSLMVLKRRK